MLFCGLRQCLLLSVDAVWREGQGKPCDMWGIQGSRGSFLQSSFATYVFQECSVPGLPVPVLPLPLLSEAVIFLAMTLQHARCALASAGTCG